MRIEKDPFTIKWYLDDRKIKKHPESQYRKQHDLKLLFMIGFEILVNI